MKLRESISFGLMPLVRSSFSVTEKKDILMECLLCIAEDVGGLAQFLKCGNSGDSAQDLKLNFQWKNLERIDLGRLNRLAQYYASKTSCWDLPWWPGERNGGPVY